MSDDPSELVVLLDDAGREVGTAPKASVHHSATPLHLAFSTYLFNDDGELLLTQRALTKATFPGVWTNSVCGHPAPGEAMNDAVRRRALSELGVHVAGLRVVLPDFAYRAEMDGVVEHERCPVYAAWLAPPSALRWDPAEVEDADWVRWPQFVADVRQGRRIVSAWCADQVVRLAALGPDPRRWPEGDPALLPPAAR